jgi:hypothetical protein
VGLNVYFCDVCGVRVTDVDLRSGHGMLRGRDVICATCLDMGHGKEWLASRGMAEPLPASVVSDNGLSSAADVNMVINYARDRASTVPEGSGASGPRTAIDYEDTRAVAILQQEANFSGAAAGFAALSNQVEQPRHDDDGRLDEESSDQVDPVLLKETPRDALAAQGDKHPTSPFSSDSEGSPAAVSASSAKSNGSSSSRIVAKSKSDRLRSSASAGRGNLSATAKSSAKRSSTAMSPTSSGKSSNAKSSKVSKSSSSRTKRGGDGGLSMPIKVSLITVPLLLILAVFLSVGGSGGAAKQADVKDLPAQKARIEKEFSEVKSVINNAYSSKKVSEMKAANQRWQQFLGEWDSFAKDAQRYSGWTEDQCSSYWEGLRAPDVGARTRLLRDEIAKQSAH